MAGMCREVAQHWANSSVEVITLAKKRRLFPSPAIAFSLRNRETALSKRRPGAFTSSHRAECFAQVFRQ
jgi:hypothetical protein